MRTSIFLIWFLLFCLFSHSQQFQDDDRVENQSELEPGENLDRKIKENFFLTAEVTKNECFVGEPLMAVFKAYSRLDANSQVVKRPSLTGFSVMEMVDAYNILPETESYKGKFYNTHLIRKVQLFPLQAGDFTLEAAEVESTVHFRKARGSGRGKLRDLFRSRKNDLIEKDITLQTPPVTIKVNPLPEDGQPGNFSGAVGTFEISAQMKDSVVQQFEPVSLKLVISGSGNLPLVTDPQIEWPENIKAAEPQVTENTDRYRYPLTGIKIFEYLMPTSDTGKFAIPSVKFSYFNPSEKRYKTVQTDAVHYTVVQATKKDIEIEKIETAKEKGFPLQYLYFALVVVIIIGVIIFQVMRSRKK